MVYQWKTPVFSKVSAQTAGEHIEKLSEEHGEVTPKLLLEDSRPKNAVLHPLYEWDNKKAAEKYRLHQSKLIIGNLVVVSTTSEDPQIPLVPVRAFVSVNDRNEKASYRPTLIALSEEATKEKIIANALSELRSFEQKYKGLIDTEAVIRQYLETRNEKTLP